MLPAFVSSIARRLAENLVVPLARRGVTPNTVTLLGFGFNVVTAVVLGFGHLTTGGALLFLSGIFDMLDGALARVSAQQSKFGAFLDSLLDRYSEAAILLALLFVFTTRQNMPAVLLVYAVAIGSILISYARARAEALGVECKVGMAARPERIIILGVGLLFNGTTTIAALALLAILTHATAMQRLYHVWRVTHPQTEKTPAAPAPRHKTTTT